MSVLETRGLTFTYGVGTPFEKTAMQEVSVAFEANELVGVIGHTGSGKSTLMQHLNGLLKPTAGQVLLDGTDIWAQPKKIRDVRFRVGMVFQYPEHQLFEETVYKDIAFGPRNMGLSEEAVRQSVLEAAEMVGIRPDMLGKSPFDLSGGEKRRVAIAGVCAMRPDVLILDEPTAGLDPRGRELILQQIAAYRKKNGTTVLLVSHSMEDVARIADRVLVMNAGRVAMLEETAAVFSRADELEEMGLAVPAVTRVFMQLKARGYDVGDNVYTTEAACERLAALLRKGGAVC